MLWLYPTTLLSVPPIRGLLFYCFRIVLSVCIYTIRVVGARTSYLFGTFALVRFVDVRTRVDRTSRFWIKSIHFPRIVGPTWYEISFRRSEEKVTSAGDAFQLPTAGVFEFYKKCAFSWVRSEFSATITNIRHARRYFRLSPISAGRPPSTVAPAYVSI